MVSDCAPPAGQGEWSVTVSSHRQDVHVMVLEAVGAALLQAVATQGSQSGVQELGRRFSFRARRDARRLQYDALSLTVVRAQLRIDLVLAIHATMVNPLNVSVQWSGISLITQAMDRALVDLSEVIGAWHRVRALAPDSVGVKADVLLTSLAQLLQNPDPGFHRPRRRRVARNSTLEARSRYEEALRKYALACRVDTSPSRRRRREARQELEALDAATAT